MSCKMTSTLCACSLTPAVAKVMKRRRRSDIDSLTKGDWMYDRYAAETHTNIFFTIEALR